MARAGVRSRWPFTLAGGLSGGGSRGRVQRGWAQPSKTVDAIPKAGFPLQPGTPGHLAMAPSWALGCTLGRWGTDLPVAGKALMWGPSTFSTHLILRAAVGEAEVQRGILYLPTVVGGRAGTLEPSGELGGA